MINYEHPLNLLGIIINPLHIPPDSKTYTAHLVDSCQQLPERIKAFESTGSYVHEVFHFEPYPLVWCSLLRSFAHTLKEIRPCTFTRSIWYTWHTPEAGIFTVDFNKRDQKLESTMISFVPWPWVLLLTTGVACWLLRIPVLAGEVGFKTFDGKQDGSFHPHSSGRYLYRFLALCLVAHCLFLRFFPLPPDNLRFHTAFLKFGYLQLALGCDVYASKSSCLLVYTAKSLHPQIIQPQKLHQNLITVIINQREGFILSFRIRHHS